MNAEINQRQLRLIGWAFQACGILSLVASAIAYHYVVSGLITHQQLANADETKRLTALLESAGDVRRRHQELTEELAELEQRAEMIRQRIPDQPHEGEFLKQMTEAATARGLTIRSYNRGNVTVADTHSQLEVRLTGEGDYASICGFFEALAKLPRVARVQRMTLSSNGSSDLYPLDLTLLLYFGARAPEAEEHNG